MHLYSAGTQSPPEIVELDIGMVGKQGHGNRRIGKPLGNHERSEALPKGIIMGAGLPDRNLFCLPGLDRSYRDCAVRYDCDVSSAGSTGILREGHGVKFDHPRCQLPVVLWKGRRFHILPFASRRVVEGPVFDVSLTSPDLPSISP